MPIPSLDPGERLSSSYMQPLGNQALAYSLVQWKGRYVFQKERLKTYIPLLFGLSVTWALAQTVGKYQPSVAFLAGKNIARGLWSLGFFACFRIELIAGRTLNKVKGAAQLLSKQPVDFPSLILKLNSLKPLEKQLFLKWAAQAKPELAFTYSLKFCHRGTGQISESRKYQAYVLSLFIKSDKLSSMEEARNFLSPCFVDLNYEELLNLLSCLISKPYRNQIKLQEGSAIAPGLRHLVQVVRERVIETGLGLEEPILKAAKEETNPLTQKEHNIELLLHHLDLLCKREELIFSLSSDGTSELSFGISRGIYETFYEGLTDSGARKSYEELSRVE